LVSGKQTVSNFYTRKVSKKVNVSTGEFLVNLRNELEEYGPNAFIEEFVSVGPKNNAFSVYSHSTAERLRKCKVKGKHKIMHIHRPLISVRFGT
jgi:hypothetical protein